MSNGSIVQDVLIAVGLIGGTLLYFRSRIPQENVKNLTLLVDTYEKRIHALEDELKLNHQVQLQNVANISDLQGQVKVYKELPLQELADGIKEVVTISKENVHNSQQILESLQQSAVIAANVANDGGLLVKTKPGNAVTVKMEEK